ncbi:MAG: insulinase family protein [Bacteroidales bacterium]|nr:insulinase family protein [Bacteroidales bacterium]
MTIDRTKAPDYKTIDSIEYIKANPLTLDNNIQLFTIHVGYQEVIKLDFIFEAGEWVQNASLISEYTVNMLQEGTQKFAASELAEKLDYLGAYIYYSSTKHTNVISVYTLSKHIIETLGIIEDIIKRPIFPEHRFSVYNGKKLQQYIIESQKVEVISQQIFSKNLFGNNHPYGISASTESFEKINLNHLISFHQTNIRSNNCKIIAAGMVDEQVIQAINKYFGGNDWACTTEKPALSWQKEPSNNYKQYLEKPDAVQSAIRIGKELVNKHHPDFPALQVFNTVFGGYFSSRLMTNIREDKGYTYGIGSGLVSHREAGYFVIVSQVGKDVYQKALHEIYYELEKLQKELIPDEELQLVKNYMMGTILRNFDGAFALSENLKTLLEYNIGYEYYDNFIQIVRNVSSTDLQAIAISYFKDQQLYEVIAG